MAFEPKRPRRSGRIGAGISPPGSFIAAAVDLAMVPAAQRNNEFIADLPAERPALRKAKMMGICWPSPADQARMLGDKLDVIPVTHPVRFRHRRALLSIACGRVRLFPFGAFVLRPLGF